VPFAPFVLRLTKIRKVAYSRLLFFADEYKDSGTSDFTTGLLETYEKWLGCCVRIGSKRKAGTAGWVCRPALSINL